MKATINIRSQNVKKKKKSAFGGHCVGDLISLRRMTCTRRTSTAGVVAAVGLSAMSSNLLCIRTSSALSIFMSNAYLT